MFGLSASICKERLSMKIYGIIRDCGDGSSCVDFVTNWPLAEKVMEKDPESYYSNEGGPSFTLNLPDDANLEEIGITLSDDNLLGD